MKNSGRKMGFEDKIAVAVYMAILDVKAENKEEEKKKMEYMIDINKVICHYEELKPILNDFFESKKYFTMDR